MNNKIFIAADHGGFELKEKLKSWLEELRYKVRDFGAYSLVPDDDYPVFVIDLATELVSQEDSLGILLCRSGGGMVIAANKVKSIRAVAVHDKKSAIHAKADNNANIISISADWTTEDQAKEMILAFLNTDFSGSERHIRRISQIEKFENQQVLEEQ
jgi:ribose 5-phosphate isomerase B